MNIKKYILIVVAYWCCYGMSNCMYQRQLIQDISNLADPLIIKILSYTNLYQKLSFVSTSIKGKELHRPFPAWLEYMIEHMTSNQEKFLLGTMLIAQIPASDIQTKNYCIDLIKYSFGPQKFYKEKKICFKRSDLMSLMTQESSELTKFLSCFRLVGYQIDITRNKISQETQEDFCKNPFWRDLLLGTRFSTVCRELGSYDIQGEYNDQEITFTYNAQTQHNINAYILYRLQLQPWLQNIESNCLQKPTHSRKKIKST